MADELWARQTEVLHHGRSNGFRLLRRVTKGTEGAQRRAVAASCKGSLTQRSRNTLRKHRRLARTPQEVLALRPVESGPAAGGLSEFAGHEAGVARTLPPTGWVAAATGCASGVCGCVAGDWGFATGRRGCVSGRWSCATGPWSCASGRSSCVSVSWRSLSERSTHTNEQRSCCAPARHAAEVGG